MRSVSRPAALVALIPLAACVAPQPAAPPPPPVAVPAPLPPAPPRTTDWRDIPLTPGDWRYDAATLTAQFGPANAPVFTARCDAAARTVTLIVPAAASATAPAPAAAAATMAITTSAGNRALAATPVTTPAPALAAVLPARDGFLDRMAFSRGRFVVAVGSSPRLVIPAWPEFARAVEECRG